MRKISEMSGTEGIKALGRMMPCIEKMIKKAGERKSKSAFEYLGSMLESAPEETVSMMAAIDDVPVEEYKRKSFLELLKDVNDMVNDEQLLGLFGLQRMTETSSTSASENTEV